MLRIRLDGSAQPHNEIVNGPIGREGVVAPHAIEDLGARDHFAAALGERSEAYERLLGDALIGSPRRFARQDVVEQTWRVVQPTLDEPGPVHPYFRGSWGPSEADRLLADGDHWFEPSS